MSQAVCKNVRIISARSWNARLIHEEELGGRGNAEDTPVRPIHTAHTGREKRWRLRFRRSRFCGKLTVMQSVACVALKLWGVDRVKSAGEKVL